MGAGIGVGRTTCMIVRGSLVRLNKTWTVLGGPLHKRESQDITSITLEPGVKTESCCGKPDAHKIVGTTWPLFSACWPQPFSGSCLPSSVRPCFNSWSLFFPNFLVHSTVAKLRQRGHKNAYFRQCSIDQLDRWWLHICPLRGQTFAVGEIRRLQCKRCRRNTQQTRKWLSKCCGRCRRQPVGPCSTPR